MTKRRKRRRKRRRREEETRRRITLIGTDHSREESECLQILQDVAVLGGDQQHVQPLQRLVHITDTLSLHKCVLFARVHELRKRCQEPLDTRSGHLHKLPRYQGCGERGRIGVKGF